MALSKGDVAPEFKLYSSDKELVSLSDHSGKVRLLFPQAFSGVCTTEMCTVRDDIAFYNDMDAEVFGISVDSVDTLNKFKEDQNLNFTLLSDFNKETSLNYDCLHEVFSFDRKGVSKRSAFVVDKNGIIRYAEILDNPIKVPNFDAIKEVIASLNK